MWDILSIVTVNTRSWLRKLMVSGDEVLVEQDRRPSKRPRLAKGKDNLQIFSTTPLTLTKKSCCRTLKLPMVWGFDEGWCSIECRNEAFNAITQFEQSANLGKEQGAHSGASERFREMEDLHEQVKSLSAAQQDTTNELWISDAIFKEIKLCHCLPTIPDF